MHSGVDHRFKKEEDVAGAAAAEGRRHVDVPLIVDFQFTPHRAEDSRAACLSLRFAHVGRRHPHAHAVADLRGGIGHDADDLFTAC